MGFVLNIWIVVKQALMWYSIYSDLVILLLSWLKVLNHAYSNWILSY